MSGLEIKHGHAIVVWCQYSGHFALACNIEPRIVGFPKFPLKVKIICHYTGNGHNPVIWRIDVEHFPAINVFDLGRGFNHMHRHYGISKPGIFLPLALLALLLVPQLTQAQQQRPARVSFDEMKPAEGEIVLVGRDLEVDRLERELSRAEDDLVAVREELEQPRSAIAGHAHSLESAEREMEAEADAAASAASRMREGVMASPSRSDSAVRSGSSRRTKR